MKVSAAALVALTCGMGFSVSACGGSKTASCQPPAARAPHAAPDVVLTPDEKSVWAPLPPDRSAVPVLLYHGIGPESDFSNSADASYGVNIGDFAKQMTMIKHAGYQTISLTKFINFIRGKRVELPPRPLLLTFDDGRADSWTGADGILEKLHFNAVMFVDTGRVERCDPEYLSWDELQKLQSGSRWRLQLHAGPDGHQYIQYGRHKDDTGAYYAYEYEHESFDDWQDRVRSDIDEGGKLLAEHVATYKPLAFAPPYGTYGQDGTNDSRIPGNLLEWLTQDFEAVFTQDQNALAHADAKQPLGRIQVTRATTGGDLHGLLLSGKT
jgi:peptidoglycan/xylan/chitin deacetylase (PgdA/CDA1 family)